ncbi:Cro/C1-type helix-turn-helix domain containing protein [uncultured Caudovirales phage]|uniref:Cro/C1-type helix-turn-helix domain containing protein n=1 Tax=uncultured Caudovirales phage TaxID=2100421 RepID=A0A6J5N6E3_9CAUD|nr:Cro/C1-type helix-turn-helix domain containing protein [uncultured Caudovirales phage]
MAVTIELHRFREKLFWRMAELQLCPAGLARVYGVTRRQIDRIIAAKKIHERTLIRLSAVLDVPLTYWSYGFQIPKSPASMARKKLYEESSRRVGAPLEKNER